ncbi:MAG: UvrD-helicase domain-containing protein [Acholeplasmatales bacterium]|nr:UvrD-helicase domain-containing protein [Acholeplasmatales bacterium]
MAWTDEQKRAIFERGSNIIVSAGAGSGKTAVLSERILEYCKSGNDIRNVLVLTFTNAAAAEMKERIRQKLIDNNLLEQASLIDAAFITTFDAYSLSLVKKYYYKLGLTPNIGIMDASLISLKKSEIIEDLFNELYLEENERFLSFLSNYSKQDDKRIVNIIDDLCNQLDLIIDLDDFIVNYNDNYLSDAKIDSIVSEYCDFLNKEFNILNDSFNELLYHSSNDTPSKKLSSFIEEVLGIMNTIKSYEDYYKLLDIKLPNTSPKASPVVKEVKTRANELLKEFKKLVPYPYKENMRNEIISTKDAISFLLELSYKAMSRLYDYKKSLMQFNFNDIAKLAIKLVKENSDVKEELKYYYKEILIDEYQDTSDIQEAFINLIENNNLYMVGDIKQSIYRFRNANPYIFKNKYDKYSKNDGGIKIDLSYNFRSRKEVLDDINKLFNALMTEECGDADYVKDHQMKYGQKDYEMISQDYSFNLDILSYNNEELKNIPKEVKEAFIAAVEVKRIMDSGNKVLRKNEYKRVSYSDFAILIDKSAQFVLFKEVFEYFNIPMSIEADLDLKESALPKLFGNIVLCINSIKNNDINNKKYKHARASIARSFLYSYSDEDIYLMTRLDYEYPIDNDLKYLASLNDISYSNLFYEICDVFKIYQNISLIGDVDNLVVVLERIHGLFKMFNDANMSMNEFAESLFKLLDSSVDIKYSLSNSSGDSVRIMTIHKSKGLEFPYCIFPMLSSKFNNKDAVKSVGYHKKYGIYVPFADMGKSDTIVKKLITDSITRDDISEKARLFYVALTRAREKMIIILENSEYDDLRLDKLNSFNKMINYANVFDFKQIDLNDYNITLNYKLKKGNMGISGKKVLEYKELEMPSLIESKRISKVLKELPSKELKRNIKLGLEFHSALEALDFKNPNVDSLPINQFMKNTINKILAHPILENIALAKTYHEHEFYFNSGNNSYHGIIDILVEYDDHIDIIDYKLSNTDSEDYIKQLAIYKEYVASISNKRINVYLLSILKAEIKELDI